ncbi:N-acetylneuraminate synthase family protein [Paraglaciecola sp.]|nr:N-acetylneuraminate synthase family protein [Paraglaciecola sp.]
MKQSNPTRCYMIAEIGVNHSGDIAVAKKMITAAKLSGADAVKFQTFTAEALVSKGTPKVKYQETTTDVNESHYDMIKSLEFKREDHLPVIEFCKSLDIDFISTPYDADSASFLNGIGVSIFKTASADIVDLDLHNYLSKLNKRVIIATGMSTLGEVEDVVKIYQANNTLDKISLLHCVSNYPCQHENLNIRSMQTLANAFGVEVGFSDHSIGPIGAIVSVSLGATVVEKHFTLDKSMEGPDHKASSTPEEFKELVDSVRTAELCLGGFQKEVVSEELQMRSVSRKSLFLKNNIAEGKIIADDDLCLKRPGTGLYAKYRNYAVGSKAAGNLTQGEMLEFGDFCGKY